MSMHKTLAFLALTLSFGTGTAFAQSPGLGKPIRNRPNPINNPKLALIAA